VVAYTTNAGILRAVTLTDGVLGPEQAVSENAVLEDPSVATNDAAVAHLAIDGTTVHALWTDDASGDILHGRRALGGGWSAPETARSSGGSVAWWVYGNVYVRGGRRRLGFTYDVGV